MLVFLFFVVLMLGAAYWGYQLGKREGFLKGTDRGSVTAIRECQYLPEEEKALLSELAKKRQEARSTAELYRLRSEILSRIPPTADFTRHMKDEEGKKNTAHLLPRFRDIMIREIDESIKTGSL